MSGQGYYDRNPGYSNPDPQHGADGYSDYQKPDQPEYEPSGYDQSNPPRGGSDPAGYPRGGPRPDAYAGQESGSGNDHYSQGYAQNGAYSEQDSYPEEDVHGSDGRYDDPAETRRRGGLWTVIAVLGLAIVGTAGAFTYRATFGKSGSSQPQVIKRDAGPTKMAVAQGNDPQFGKPGLERVERIVPRGIAGRSSTDARVGFASQYRSPVLSGPRSRPPAKRGVGTIAINGRGATEANSHRTDQAVRCGCERCLGKSAACGHQPGRTEQAARASAERASFARQRGPRPRRGAGQSAGDPCAVGVG